MSSAPPSFTGPRPANWKSLAPSPLPGVTFAHQSSLFPLPLPKLSNTLAGLKHTLGPLAHSMHELDEAVSKIAEFGRQGGIGDKLHSRLEERKTEKDHEGSSWLEEWWDDLAYLTYRDSVLINVSYYYGFRPHPAHLPQAPSHRAATIVHAAMRFRQSYKLGLEPPETTRAGPLCMDSWRWMFDCCRVPGKTADWSVSHAREGDHGDSGHVIVLRRGRVWRLEPWRDGRLLSVPELQQQIEWIYENTQKEYPAVGVLTASHRDVWYKDQTLLASDPHNASILSAIHGAAFVLCLDTEKPADDVAHSRALWHGAVGEQLGLRARWMDKPCQFVVDDGGRAGFVGEHSVMDGTPTVALCDRVLDMVAAMPASAPSGLPPLDPGAAPTPLDWHVTQELRDAIAAADAAARSLIETQALGIVRTPYGKRAIKAFGVSPDAWAQLLVQLAHARLLRARGEQRAGATYEAAATRRFRKGRTEAIRVLSDEMVGWVASMDDASAGVVERAERFRVAVERHGRDARSAGLGLGVDRHLLGLRQCLDRDEGVPAIFDDPLVKRSSRWVLSTSAIFSKHFGPYGWGEVVPDGFGVAYMTGFDDYLQFTITSRTEMPHAQFCAELERAGKDMYDLHTALAQAGAAPDKAKL
ncbi:carnitine acetyl transferase [Obba rivulosa]|uniref:Carnitine acetyl transferase n=1 Tax=Obba rivulosa TaxID=1052685 RepID=A0A8E2AKL4_9APHY|nr:carnitine acetyl transferase [Obba rivulosa]